MFISKISAAIAAAAMLCSTVAAAPVQRLGNHVPHAVSESMMVGPVSETARLNLAIGLPLRNAKELDALVEQIANPHSASYRKYLSAAEFAERFGPTREDYATLVGFVQSHGFSVSATHPNRMVLDIAGPVSAINKMLHINLTVWNHPSRGRFFAPDRDPSMETDVAVLDITGLDNFVVPRPMDLKLAPLSATKPMAGSGPSGLYIGNDFRAAYAPTVSMTGAGQTIGLVEFDGFYTGDVTANFKQAGMTVPPVSTVLLDGFNGAPGSANIEVILDIAMAGYMAPGASIIVYEGYYPNDVLNRMATDNLARQLSCSWGYGINGTTEQIFTQMIAQGQSFFTASGDSGAYSNGVMPPADDPNVTSVGGTALTTTGPGGSWLAESAWSGSGGGVSTTYPIPSYQQSVNMAAQGGSNTMRNMPDVALTGAVQMYLIFNNGQQTAVGGTSAATPLWAAFTALVNQQAAANSQPAVGFLNPMLYSIGTGTGYNSAMHDITTGNNGFAAIPGYDLTTGWGSPTGQPLINDLSSMPSAPSFTLSASPNTFSVPASSVATSTIQVTPANGFSGAVTLKVSGLPAGVTGTFSASVLTLAVTSAAAPGSYPFVVSGVSGALTSSVSLTLTVTAAPSFKLTAPTAETLLQGATGTAAIAVVPANGFSGSVALTVSGLPAGVTASFNPASTASASTLNFVATASAAVGTATVTVTGKSGNLTSTAAIALTVAPPALFTLTASTPTLSILQGAGATSTITVAPKTGFTGKVALTATGLPTGVTVSFNPASTATSSVATFSATSAAATGTSTVIITGSLGAASTSVTLSLTVKTGQSFTIGAAPASLSVTQGASGTTTITVTPLNGFTGTPVFAITGLPTGVTAAISAGALRLTASASAAAGLATVTVTGTSGTLSAQTTVALTIIATSGFTLTSSASGVSVAVGSTGTSTISVSPQGGFSGSVALTVAGLPAGVTSSFSSATTKTTSTLTLTVASSAAQKASSLVITGTSGSLTATLPLTLTVTSASNFTMALAPATLHVMEGGKGSTAIALTPVNGSLGSVAIAASGLPTGVTASFTTINPQLVLTVFSVSASAAAGTSQVTLTATSGTVSHAATLSLTVVAPTAATAVVDLSPAYNVPGMAVDNLPFTGGGLDTGGRSYSGTLLGASQSIGGTMFAIGPMGLPDSVSGQTVALPAGEFTQLKMLATGLNGNQTGQKFTITYADGSTTVWTQSLSDWFTPQNYAGETQAMKMNYRDNSTGTTDGELFYLYDYSFVLNNAKIVKSITLPANRNVVAIAITLTGSASVKSTK
jgi:hypothetical protein